MLLTRPALHGFFNLLSHGTQHQQQPSGGTITMNWAHINHKLRKSAKPYPQSNLVGAFSQFEVPSYKLIPTFITLT